jgi:hypothetical protein
VIIWLQNQETQADSKKHTQDKDGNGKRKRQDVDKEKRDI